MFESQRRGGISSLCSAPLGDKRFAETFERFDELLALHAPKSGTHLIAIGSGNDIPVPSTAVGQRDPSEEFRIISKMQ